MTSSKNTFIAFLLNLGFAIIEIIFGLLFQSSAVLADAIHDLGDALAIGGSAIMQKYAEKPADARYPFGYKRWNTLAALLTATILISGSGLVLFENIPQLFNPQPVNQDGMLILGLVAIVINLLATKFVQDGHSHNQSILSLHFLEDILGWLGVIIVSIVLQFTDWYILDPLLAIGISIFILSQALPKAVETIKILLETQPHNLPLDTIHVQLLEIDGIQSIENLQIWTLDGYEHCATIRLSLNQLTKTNEVKEQVRTLLASHNITQITIEID